MEKKEIVKLQAEDKDEQEEEYVYALHSRIYNWFAPAGIDNTFYSVSGAWKCFRQRCISSGLLLEQIAASPRIYSIPNFLSAEELREMHKYIDWFGVVACLCITKIDLQGEYNWRIQAFTCCPRGAEPRRLQAKII